MSIVIDDASTPGSEVPGAPAHPVSSVEPARRGTTTIATTAIERVVGRVAVETPGVATVQLTGIKGWLHDDSAAGAETEVQSGDGGLRISISLAVVYPEPVAEVAAQVRQRVTAALRDQVAMTAERIDVTVTELRRRPRGRVAIGGRVR